MPLANGPRHWCQLSDEAPLESSAQTPNAMHQMSRLGNKQQDRTAFITNPQGCNGLLDGGSPIPFQLSYHYSVGTSFNPLAILNCLIIWLPKNDVDVVLAPSCPDPEIVPGRKRGFGWIPNLQRFLVG